jgi:hypothetical protein
MARSIGASCIIKPQKEHSKQKAGNLRSARKGKHAAKDTDDSSNRSGQDSESLEESEEIVHQTRKKRKICMSTGDSASKRKSKGKSRQKELVSKQVSEEEVEEVKVEVVDVNKDEEPDIEESL